MRTHGFLPGQVIREKTLQCGRQDGIGVAFHLYTSLGKHLGYLPMKTPVGCLLQLRREVKIMVSRNGIDVAQISRQMRQFDLEIRTRFLTTALKWLRHCCA